MRRGQAGKVLALFMCLPLALSAVVTTHAYVFAYEDGTYYTEASIPEAPVLFVG
jgi:hypothetical protein